MLRQANQYLEDNLTTNEEINLLHQERSDTQQFATRYLFKYFWIEIVAHPEAQDATTGNKKLYWKALIYFQEEESFVFTVGLYTNRLEAAIKAEQLVCRWVKF